MVTGRRRCMLLSLVCLGLFFYAIVTTVMLCEPKKEATASTQMSHCHKIPTDIIAQLASEALFDKMGNKAKTVVFEELVNELNMPMIFVDNYGKPMIWFNIEHGPWYNRQEIDYDDTTFHSILILKEKVKEFEKKYDPKLVYYRDNKTKIGWLYYDDIH